MKSNQLSVAIFLGFGILLSIPSGFAQNTKPNLKVAAFRGGHGAGNGGDPYVTDLKKFEHPDLEAAISLAIEKVEVSEYDQRLKIKFKEEIEILAEKELFYYTDQHLYLNGAAIVHDKDGALLISNGEVELGKGNPIVYGKVALSYDLDKLTEMLIHPILHRVLPKSIQREESFVSNLARAFMTEITDQQANEVIKREFDESEIEESMVFGANYSNHKIFPVSVVNNIEIPYKKLQMYQGLDMGWNLNESAFSVALYVGARRQVFKSPLYLGFKGAALFDKENPQVKLISDVTTNVEIMPSLTLDYMFNRKDPNKYVLIRSGVDWRKRLSFGIGLGDRRWN